MSIPTSSYYPFSAVIGQDTLKTALLLSACDPLLGGVLISGNRGTAKSTLARSLADLLDNSPFVNCPLGVSEDRLLGSLDVQYALANKGHLKFSAGLFAQADGGVLYVDEINLLPDHLVDLLLDVSASGINYLERDGISHQHSAQFILIGSMNPEEGALRPQLLDRFALSVNIQHNPDLQQRIAIVEARLAFDHNPQIFHEKYRKKQKETKQLIQRAKHLLQQVNVSSDNKLDIAQRCLQAGVEGVRADLALYRAARAHAAIRGKNTLHTEDIDAVADLVLAHRQQENSQQPATSSSSTADNQQDSMTPQSASEQDQLAQGDWGEMPLESVEMGVQRQLDPNRFSQHQASSQQKKKR
jgi:magnesium chelatase subunit I